MFPAALISIVDPCTPILSPFIPIYLSSSSVFVQSDEEELAFEKIDPCVEDESRPVASSLIAELVSLGGSYRMRMQTLNVFCPAVDPTDGACIMKKLELSAPEAARAPDVIVAALQTMQSLHGPGTEEILTFHTNANFYRLRVAEVSHLCLAPLWAKGHRPSFLGRS